MSGDDNTISFSFDLDSNPIDNDGSKFVGILEQKNEDDVAKLLDNLFILMISCCILYVLNVNGTGSISNNYIIDNHVDYENNKNDITDLINTLAITNATQKENVLIQCVSILNKVISTQNSQYTIPNFSNNDEIKAFLNATNIQLNDILEISQIDTTDIIKDILTRFYNTKTRIEEIISILDALLNNKNKQEVLANLYQQLLEEFAKLPTILSSKDEDHSQILVKLSEAKQNINKLLNPDKLQELLQELAGLQSIFKTDNEGIDLKLIAKIKRLLNDINKLDSPSPEDISNTYQELLYEIGKLQDVFSVQQNDKERIVKYLSDTSKKQEIIKVFTDLLQKQQQQGSQSSQPFSINSSITDVWKKILQQFKGNQDDVNEAIKKLQAQANAFQSNQEKYSYIHQNYINEWKKHANHFISNPDATTLIGLMSVMTQDSSSRSQLNKLVHEQMIANHRQKLQEAQFAKQSESLARKSKELEEKSSKIKAQRETLEQMKVDIITLYNKVKDNYKFTNNISDLFNIYSELDVKYKYGELDDKYNDYIKDVETKLSGIEVEFEQNINRQLQQIKIAKQEIEDYHQECLKINEVFPAEMQVISLYLDETYKKLESKTDDNELLRFFKIKNDIDSLLKDYKEYQEWYGKTLDDIENVRTRFVTVIGQLKQSKIFNWIHFTDDEVNKVIKGLFSPPVQGGGPGGTDEEPNVFEHIDTSLALANSINNTTLSVDEKTAKLEEAFDTFANFVLDFKLHVINFEIENVISAVSREYDSLKTNAKNYETTQKTEIKEVLKKLNEFTKSDLYNKNKSYQTAIDTVLSLFTIIDPTNQNPKHFTGDEKAVKWVDEMLERNVTGNNVTIHTFLSSLDSEYNTKTSSDFANKEDLAKFVLEIQSANKFFTETVPTLIRQLKDVIDKPENVILFTHAYIYKIYNDLFASITEYTSKSKEVPKKLEDLLNDSKTQIVLEFINNVNQHNDKFVNINNLTIETCLNGHTDTETIDDYMTTTLPNLKKAFVFLENELYTCILMFEKLKILMTESPDEYKLIQKQDSYEKIFDELKKYIFDLLEKKKNIETNETKLTPIQNKFNDRVDKIIAQITKQTINYTVQDLFNFLNQSQAKMNDVDNIRVILNLSTFAPDTDYKPIVEKNKDNLFKTQDENKTTVDSIKDITNNSEPPTYYGKFSEVLFSGINIDGGGFNIETDVDLVLSKISLAGDITEIPHFVYTAYGFSGSGKSYLLTGDHDHSIFKKLYSTIEDQLKSFKTSMKKNLKMKVFFYDYYGEILDNKCIPIGDNFEKTEDQLLNLEYDNKGFFRKNKVTFYKHDKTTDEIDFSEDKHSTLIGNDTYDSSYKYEVDLSNITGVSLIEQMKTEYDNVNTEMRKNMGGSDADDPYEYHIRATPNNDQSSRSHLFMDTLLYNGINLLGKFTIIDMAGNEKVDQIQNSYFDTTRELTFGVSKRKFNIIKSFEPWEKLIQSSDDAKEKEKLYTIMLINNIAVIQDLVNLINELIYHNQLKGKLFLDTNLGIKTTYKNLLIELKKILIIVNDYSSKYYELRLYRILDGNRIVVDINNSFNDNDLTYRFTTYFLLVAFTDQVIKFNNFSSTTKITFNELFKNIRTTDRNNYDDIINNFIDDKNASTSTYSINDYVTFTKGFLSAYFKEFELRNSELKRFREIYNNNYEEHYIYIVTKLKKPDSIISTINKFINQIHCPLRYQGNFINRTLANMKEYAEFLEVSDKGAQLSDDLRKKEIMLRLLYLGKPPSDEFKFITKLNIFINIRLDFQLDGNGNVTDNSKTDDPNNIFQDNKVQRENIRDAFKMSVEYGHCVNPLRNEGEASVTYNEAKDPKDVIQLKFHTCEEKGATQGGGDRTFKLEVYQGGAQVYDVAVGENTIAFFAVASFLLSLLAIEKFIGRGVIPGSNAYVIPCFLVMYSILMSIITLANGIRADIFTSHIGSLYVSAGLLYVPWSLSAKKNKPELFLLIVWIISLWWSFCMRR